MVKATEGCPSLWTTSWPKLHPKALEAIGSMEWTKFLMEWPRAMNIDGKVADIEIHRITELFMALEDPGVDVA
eukprot:1185445-Karenia_brevis.AAC.1